MTPTAWSGPLLAGAGLLVAAGVAKAWRPEGTARALEDAGLPIRTGWVRAAALAEALIGVAAAAIGGWLPASAVAASYGAFAAFVAVARRRGWVLSSCGCFGEPDSPPTILHVVVDLGLAGAALAAALAGGPAPLVLAARRPGWGIAMVALAAVVGGMCYLALSALPRLEAELP